MYYSIWYNDKEPVNKCSYIHQQFFIISDSLSRYQKQIKIVLKKAFQNVRFKTKIDMYRSAFIQLSAVKNGLWVKSVLFANFQ